MNEEEIRQWLIKCFGPVQGEEAWQQLNQLPFEVRNQLMNQKPDDLPNPEEVRTMMQAFSDGGLNSPVEMTDTLQKGPINAKLAQSLALQQATGDNSSVNADVADGLRRSISKANLWLDITTNFNPAPGNPDILSRGNWVEGTIESWIKFATPVARAISDAFTSVIANRFSDIDDAEISGVFAGVVPIPLPKGMNNPVQLMKLLANTSFAMQLGSAAGALSHEVHGSFDQGIALLKNPAGGLIPYNCIDYAKVWGLNTTEVMDYLALRELAHARLFASVPWLMTRFEALIIKYSNGINIDLDAMEDQLRDVDPMNPEAISGAVNLSKVGNNDSDEQKQALKSFETLLALTEGWVDCVTWRAGMAHIPHIDQLREMTRRERAAGGPAEVTFESLLGLNLRPKRMREAADLWEKITQENGIEKRDSLWAHPDLLPELHENDSLTNSTDSTNSTNSQSEISSNDENDLQISNIDSKNENTNCENHNNTENNTDTNANDINNSESITDLNEDKKEKDSENLKDLKDLKDLDNLDSINWDDELSKLLENMNSEKNDNNNSDSNNSDSNNCANKNLDNNNNDNNNDSKSENKDDNNLE